jgi:hypothetical protein
MAQRNCGLRDHSHSKGITKAAMVSKLIVAIM